MTRYFQITELFIKLNAMMTPRDTTTGSNYEQIIELCLKRSCERNQMVAIPQVNVGIKPGGGKHRVDWEISKKNDINIRGLISCKFQKTSGTAEEKIAYEVIKLLHAMKLDPRYKHAWIVMGGDGWSIGMRNFVLEHLSEWIPEMKTKISVLSTDQLINQDIDL
jgi:hypothetical protein